MPGWSFSIDVEDGPDESVVSVNGELDLVTGPDLLAALDRVPAERQLVVDMSEVTFLDSTGLSALLIGNKRRVRRGADPMVVRRPSWSVVKLFELTGLAGVLKVTLPAKRPG